MQTKNIRNQALLVCAIALIGVATGFVFVRILTTSVGAIVTFVILLVFIGFAGDKSFGIRTLKDFCFFTLTVLFASDVTSILVLALFNSVSLAFGGPTGPCYL